MIRRMIPLLIIAFALPIFAQTTATTTTTTTTKKVTKAHVTKKAKRTSTTGRTAVWNDATRLAALLRDAQANIDLSATTWRTVANEANALSNRIYARTSGSGRTAARDLRMHVREMRTTALAGDAAAARTHASEAMPFVTRVIEWSMPATK